MAYKTFRAEGKSVYHGF